MLSTRFVTAVALTLGLTQASAAAPQTPASQTPESAIVAAVKRALSGQSDLRKLAVSADGSQVKLTGRVPTLWLKMDAVKRTLKVDGVKTILSEIELPKSESDTNLAAALRRAIDGYPVLHRVRLHRRDDPPGRRDVDGQRHAGHEQVR